MEDRKEKIIKSIYTLRIPCYNISKIKHLKGLPDCGGWHFYMPGSCVEQIENGARVKFPPAWRSIRILSPYVEGKRTAAIEYPIEDALALLRAMFAQH